VRPGLRAAVDNVTLSAEVTVWGESQVYCSLRSWVKGKLVSLAWGASYLSTSPLVKVSYGLQC